MTVQEMVDEVKASLGNRTDITDARYVQWLNWAQLDFCGRWARRGMNSRNFKVLERSILFETTVLEDQCASTPANNYTIYLSATHQGTTTNQYVDYVIELTDYDYAGAGLTEAPAGLLGQKRTIVWSGTADPSVQVTPDFTVRPDQYTSYALYKRVYNIGAEINLDPRHVLWAIQRIEAVDGGTTLTMKPWGALVGTDYTNTGTPSAYAHRGESILFDVTPETEEWYRFYYYMHPTAMTATNMSTACVLPENWHEFVVLGAVYRGFAKLMEPDRAAEALAEYLQAIAQRIDEEAIENRNMAQQFTMRFE